jgi:hypothetical protein
VPFAPSKPDQIIGQLGRLSGVCHFTVPRAGEITEAGMAIPARMVKAMVLGFRLAGDGKATITGDSLMAADEANPVLSS